MHGFKVVEPNGRAISVGQWLVPRAPSRRDEPDGHRADSATLGTTAKVTVAWHDLQAGTAYLGAITHADAAGILQVTLIDVAT